MKHELQQKMINILARCMDMTIATTRSDGSPQATVVSFVHDGLLLYFGCGAGSQKAVNISRDPRVSVAMTAPYENWLEIKGVVDGGYRHGGRCAFGTHEVGRLMVQRFPQISAIQPSEAAPVKLFRVRPTIISVLDYSLGFGHTDLVKIEADDIAETLDSMRHHWLVGTSATS